MRSTVGIACSIAGWLSLFVALCGVVWIVMPCSLGMMIMSRDSTTWLVSTIAGTAAFALLGVALVQGGRRMGTKRAGSNTCLRCGYSLIGLRADRCPECGEGF